MVSKHHIFNVFCRLVWADAVGSVYTVENFHALMSYKKNISGFPTSGQRLLSQIFKRSQESLMTGCVLNP